MRKRINTPRDAKASRPAAGNQSSFRKRSGDAPKWEVESRFSKPSIKKSSLRTSNAAPAPERPARKPGTRKEGDWNSFPRQGEDKPKRYGKTGHAKPYSEGRSFDRPDRDKPFRSFEKSDDTRSFRPKRDTENGDRPAYDGSTTRKFGKSSFEARDRSKPSFGDKKPYGKPSFDKSRDTDRKDYTDRQEGADKPFRAREDRPAYGKPEFRRNDAEKRFEKPFERTSSREDRPAREESAGKREGKISGTERRVGRFENAPRYNLSDYEKKNGGKQQKQEKSDYIRLNRYIANAGICSRREADDLISSGQISVNGKTVTEMGYKVQLSDVVKYGKRALNPEKMVYILINKPKDYITTTDDPEERKTVLDLIEGACQERVYPVGRLDRNTTGLLLLTNDGELAEKLTHPSSGIKKIYQAELDKPITNEDFELLQHGLELEDGFIHPDEVGIVTPDAMVVGLEIHSGRNRIVRRMFEHLGYEVQKLDRTVFAGLNKKDLPRGKWRFLSEKEVIKLKFMM
ncbi:hypothetical protein DYBT9275_04579 [Dyadobacter sp. CECT 9275]|uniref:Pseudouridine synthase n=1 Tax=Dyadobacter helix TaxID=2822344 RepID=A0A916JFP0_9BACT|nr:pseudouridine synthase [Dyadobacter sp. CECT 9275]CAG5009835.1 hypothetical protein DYBT9275_04579 [Dyadobacter sp. CECT 9275]